MSDPGLTGAALLCEALLAAGVRVLFGIPGGAIMPFYDALPAYPALRHVLCRHEQGAGHAAQGYARASGAVGVCVATSGPGATNLVTPLADAWMDGTPLLAITGQVASGLLGTDAFQEIDFTGITLPVCKHSALVTRAADIPAAVADAVARATAGRPGPVVLDVTRDAQQGRAPRPAPTPVAAGAVARPGPPEALRRAAALLDAAARPLILAGHGVIQAGATGALLALAERCDAPVATTLLGLGAIPQAHPLSLGLAGMHGRATVNRALQRCDVLLVAGARLDDRVTGRADRFARQARIIHLDVEPAQFGRTVPAEIELAGDAADELPRLTATVTQRRRPQWRAWLAADAAERPRPRPGGGGGTLCPADFFAALDARLAGEPGAIVVTDVGQHQMWAAQLLTWRRPGAQLTSGGAGTMGFAVPAALGAAIARPAATVWAVVGDGGFQMTGAELATITQEGLANVRIAIINNGFLGMVRQWQQLFHGRRYSGTPLSGPDFVALAAAYGVPGRAVTAAADLPAALDAAAAHPGPFLLDVRVAAEANVYPIVPSGAGLDGMLEREAGQ